MIIAIIMSEMLIVILTPVVEVATVSVAYTQEKPGVPPKAFKELKQLHQKNY